MGIAMLRSGSHVTLKDRKYRLYRKISNTLWQLEDVNSSRIIEATVDQILRWHANGSLTMAAAQIATDRKFTTTHVTGPEFEAAKVRRAYVLAVLNVPSTREPMEAAIGEVWNRLKKPEAKPAYNTVYIWKTRFLRSNHDIRSLVSFTRGKGNRTDRFPAPVKEICERSIDNKYLTLERGTIESTLNDAVLATKRENQLLPPDVALPLPTRRYISRLIQRLPLFEKYAARFGRDAARRHFRFTKGHHVTERPLERVEIDHTPLDLYVVDDENSLPLGRPWITACIDDYTRCILGLYVGFISPSYQTVALCLKDCFRPKKWLKEKFPEIKCDWPAFGVMSELVVDNGREFHSESLEQACYSLGIQITYSARREPWFKGKIERFLGTLNRSIAHGNPGTTFSNIIEKGDYNPEKHAAVTLSTLHEVVRLWVADVYHQQIHRSLHTSPASLWVASLKDEDIPFADDSVNLDFIMGKADTRVLAPRGIAYEGLLYESAELRDLRDRYGTNLSVEVRIDESNLGTIQVMYPPTGIVVTGKALSFEYANSISLHQHRMFKKYQMDELPEAPGPEGWLQAKEYISRLIARDFSLKRKRSRKRTARFVEDSNSSGCTQAQGAPTGQGKNAQTPKETHDAGHVDSVQSMRNTVQETMDDFEIPDIEVIPRKDE
jgi:putative transposase